MKKKRPFYITFQDQTVIIDSSQLPKREGVVIFSNTARIEYLQQHHPEKVNEYLDHLKRFELKMKQIDNLLKK